MMGNYTESIKDCRVTLDLQPYHFGAMSGLCLCHLALHQFPEVKAFERALECHPGMTQVRGYLANLKRLEAQGGEAPPCIATKPRWLSAALVFRQT
jgi:hypothetical protein